MADSKQKRAHKATFAKNKYGAGFLIRVVGPSASRFAGREVPVTRMDDTEEVLKLDAIVWAGIDEGFEKDGKKVKGTGQPVCLYSFTPKPFEDDAEF